jgi:23S rRNA pseudouridine1911/1915/1917 synthase
LDVKEQHTVPIQPTPVRLSDYAGGIFESLPSRKGMKKAIRKELVQIDGKLAKTGDFLQGGEVITLLHVSEPTEKSIFQQQLDIFYEDEVCAVVAKPAGLLVSGNGFRTVENALPFNLQKSTEVDALSRPRPVHRLDFPTTGVLLIAKTHTVLTHLKQQFEAKTIHKTYVAVVSGSLEKEGELNTVVDGKAAHTHYETVKQREHPNLGSISLLQLQPSTGRRHQLRIQLAEAGTPILGDKDYGRTDLPKVKGLFLHAFRLDFEHPIDGERVSVEQELPRKFGRLFETLS